MIARMLSPITSLCKTIWGVCRFNRAPKRCIPDGDCIVSPAMGKVVAIHLLTSTDLTFFKHDIRNCISVDGVTLPAHVIIIELTLRDVHVQRAPIDATIMHIEHFTGKHHSAVNKHTMDGLVNTNEKVFTLFKNDTETIGVIQVAGLAARRIRSNVDVGQKIQKGEVFGNIILGSQVILIIPQIHTLKVAVGDLLIDGETVIA